MTVLKFSITLQCLWEKKQRHIILNVKIAICSIKGLSFGSKNYTKDMKTDECISFLR